MSKIQVILLKDAEADRGVVFCKAVVITEQGFEMQVATGYIRKPKALVSPKGTIAFDLPDMYVDKLVSKTESFTTVDGDIKQVTYITVGN